MKISRIYDQYFVGKIVQIQLKYECNLCECFIAASFPRSNQLNAIKLFSNELCFINYFQAVGTTVANSIYDSM